MAKARSTKSPKAAARKAAKAITELRRTVGLPTGAVAADLSEKIQQLAKDKDVLVEWQVRVIRRGDTVAALCNCYCYA